MAYIVAVCGYTFTMSAIIAKIIDLIPGLHLRASQEAELLGLDDDQHGEFAYDYVEGTSRLEPFPLPRPCLLSSFFVPILAPEEIELISDPSRSTVITSLGRPRRKIRGRMVLGSSHNARNRGTSEHDGQHPQRDHIGSCASHCPPLRCPIGEGLR